MVVLRSRSDRINCSKMGPSNANSLPTELLNVIFCFYIESFSEPTGAPDAFTEVTPNDLHSARHRVSAVCRRWHHIVKSTPRLWSDLHIHFDYPFPPLDVVQRWIRQAKRAPIYAYICGEKRPERGPESCKILVYLTELFNTVFPAVLNWRGLTLEFNEDFVDFLPFIPLYKAYNLEQLTLRSFTSSDELGTLLDTIQCTPKSLRRLTLDCNQLQIGEELLDHTFTTFSQLVHLQLTIPYMSDLQLFDLLSKCTSAHSIDITIDSYRTSRGSSSTTPAMISLPQLRVLNLFCVATPWGNNSGQTGYSSFKYFDFPSLQVLHYHLKCAPSQGSERDIMELQKFIDSPRHCLRVLRVRDKHWPQEQLLTFLSTPTLTQIPAFEVQTKRTNEDLGYAIISLFAGNRPVPCPIPSAVPHLEKPGWVSVGWVNPEFHDDRDGGRLLCWGLYFYILQAIGRVMSDLRQDYATMCTAHIDDNRGTILSFLRDCT